MILTTFIIFVCVLLVCIFVVVYNLLEAIELNELSKELNERIERNGYEIKKGKPLDINLRIRTLYLYIYLFLTCILTCLTLLTEL